MRGDASRRCSCNRTSGTSPASRSALSNRVARISENSSPVTRRARSVGVGRCRRVLKVSRVPSLAAPSRGAPTTWLAGKMRSPSCRAARSRHPSNHVEIGQWAGRGALSHLGDPVGVDLGERPPFDAHAARTGAQRERPRAGAEGRRHTTAVGCQEGGRCKHKKP